LSQQPVSLSSQGHEVAVQALGHKEFDRADPSEIVVSFIYSLVWVAFLHICSAANQHAAHHQQHHASACSQSIKESIMEQACEAHIVAKRRLCTVLHDQHAALLPLLQHLCMIRSCRPSHHMHAASNAFHAASCITFVN